MRQQLSGDWTLDLEPTFSRQETDDGFIVFRKPGLEFWAVVYAEQPFSAEEAIQSYLVLRNIDESEFKFRPNSDGIAGCAFLSSETEGWKLLAVAASLGRIVQLDFHFKDKSNVETAIAIWRSLQHSPPVWVRKCSQAEPPLAGLREALERGIHMEDAIEEVICHQQIAEAKAVLLESLKSESSSVRRESCEALRLLGEVTEEVMDALQERLEDGVVQVRAWAAETLMDLGEPSESVVPFMIDGLQTKEDTLPKGEDRIQGMCRSLSVPDRYHAARILNLIGEAAQPAKAVLLEHQMDESGGVRLEVAEALLNLGEPLENILPALRDGLHNPNFSERERMWFAIPLLNHGELHHTILPGVVDVLDNSKDNTARVEALEVLTVMGIAAQSAADTIVNAIRDESEEWGIKVPAAQTLMKIGMKQELAYPILLDALNLELDPDERVEIITDLASLNSPGDDILERVSKELGAEERKVQCAAAFMLALNSTEVERSLAVLTEALDDPDDNTRWFSIVSFGQLGSLGTLKIDRLIQIARNDELQAVRLAAIWTLGQVGRSRKQLVETFLIEVSSDADENTNIIIQSALKHLREQGQIVSQNENRSERKQK